MISALMISFSKRSKLLHFNETWLRQTFFGGNNVRLWIVHRKYTKSGSFTSGLTVINCEKISKKISQRGDVWTDPPLKSLSRPISESQHDYGWSRSSWGGCTPHGFIPSYPSQVRRHCLCAACQQSGRIRTRKRFGAGCPDPAAWDCLKFPASQHD